jgi:anti-sigma factor (TIGR02949 family)
VPCDLAAAHLHAYLDGELDAAGAASFERHMQSCAECAAALNSQENFRHTLVSAQLYEPAPAHLHTRIYSQLPAGASTRARSSRLLQWAALAAAILLAIVLGRALLQSRANTNTLAFAAVDAHLRSLQPGHLTDVQSSDQHSVKPWFDGKVNFAPTVTDFANDGFPLLGGRLDVLSGNTAAALVYGRRKHIINLFILPSQPRAPAASSNRSGDRDGYHWLSWQQNGFTYIAVSDTTPGDLEQLRALLLGH